MWSLPSWLPDDRRHSLRIGIALLALKLVLILVAVPALDLALPGQYQIHQFPDEYDDIALNLVTGNDYRAFPDTTRTMIREPGFVVLLAAVFWSFPGNLKAVQVVNLILSLMAAVGTFTLAKRVGVARGPAMGAAAIFLFHPAVILAESRGGVDILYALMAIVVVILLVSVVDQPSPKAFAALGGALGAACLVKSTLMLLPGFLLPFLLVKGRKEGARVLGRFALLCGAMALVMSPWVLRNYVLSGAFVPTMTLAGSIAQEGLWATQHGGSGRDFASVGYEAAAARAAFAAREGLRFRSGGALGGWHPIFFTPQDEIAFDRRLLSSVAHQYAGQPALLFRTIANNSWRFWIQGRTRTATALNAVLVVPLLALAIAGLWPARARGLRVAPLLVFSAYFFSAHLPLQGLARYHIPLIPVLSILGFVTLSVLFEKRLAGSDVPRSGAS